jgi:hypothetical protein
MRTCSVNDSILGGNQIGNYEETIYERADRSVLSEMQQSSIS